VVLLLTTFYGVGEHEVCIHRSSPDDFLLLFMAHQTTDRVLHANPLVDAPFLLLFHRWCHQLRAWFATPLWFKVHLSISNLPTHIWLTDSIQQIIGSSCLVFEVTPCSTSKSDMSKFMVVAWSLNPNLILAEVGCVIPEPTPCLWIDNLLSPLGLQSWYTPSATPCSSGYSFKCPKFTISIRL
jgi:hypothetical protein